MESTIYPKPFARRFLMEMYENRGIKALPKPIWKLKVSDEEYERLKNELRIAEKQERLDKYSIEALIYYAEWWRREYIGGFPSKEIIANSASIIDSELLYNAARKALEDHRFKVITVHQRREYFRTMLGQGGIPIHYVKTGTNFSNYSYFLSGLVQELSNINYDWNEGDSSIVQKLDCISKLPRSFQTEGIYDISFQIAHAIIAGDDSILPYDSDDQSLAELTKSLKREYERAKKESKIKPLSINWRLKIDNMSHKCDLYYNLDIVKEIGSESISGLSPENCFAFEVIMSGKVVAKFSRAKIEKDELTGDISRAIYVRINLGMSIPVLWRGEQMIDIKVRCDNGDRLSLVLPGSCPPDFTTPQTFQFIDENIYAKVASANKENNLAIFSQSWTHQESKTIMLLDNSLSYIIYSEDVELINPETDETIILQNSFNPYSVEYADTYLDWIEGANYKLCTSIPRIRVYDTERTLITNFKTFYCVYGSNEWKSLSRNSHLPQGLVKFKVVFPDGRYDTESFYYIGKLGFVSSDTTPNSAILSCINAEWAQVEMESSSLLSISKKGTGCWQISRVESGETLAHTCSFRFYKEGMPSLRIDVPLPFVGVSVIDLNNKLVPNRKILSYSNLLNFRIICQGQSHSILSVSYDNGDINLVSQKIDCTIPNGITPLTDYLEAYDRIFNFYGPDSFSRKESVKLSIGGITLYIRKFVLESDLEGDTVTILDKTDVRGQSAYLKTEESLAPNLYNGSLLAYPLSEDLSSDMISIYSLERVSADKNDFRFPDDFPSDRAIVFSDIADARKIVPRLFIVSNKLGSELTNDTSQNILTTIERENLCSENIFIGKEWKKAFQSFAIASKYGIPFKTFTSLWMIASSPELTARFILGMWYYAYQDVLVQDISSFEQEFVIGIHWIRHETWNKVINEFINYISTNMAPIYNNMRMKFNEGFMTLLKNLLIVTTGPESADEFIKVISQGMSFIQKKGIFMNSEIDAIRARVIGATHGNGDLPRAHMPIRGRYYPDTQMLYYYKMMLNAPICVAEYFSSVDGCIDLWSDNNIQQRRVINFYRHYFRNQYSLVLLRSLGIIANNN